jgi:hypothetical protein
MVSWPGWYRRAIVFDAEEPVRLVNGQAYLVDYRDYSNDQLRLNLAAYLTVLEGLDGTRLFAAGQLIDHANPGCSVDPAVGEHGLFMEMLGDPETAYFAWAPWGSFGTFQTRSVPVATLGYDPKQGSTLNLGVNASTAFLGFGSPPLVAALDLNGGPVRETAAQAQLSIPRVVTDGAIAVGAASTGGSASMALVKADGSFVTLLAPTAPHVITAVSIDRASNQQIAWVEGDPLDPCRNAILWTSPYATSASEVARRAVAALNDTQGRCGQYMVANAGAVLSLSDLDKAQITRLSDGMGWVVPADTGEVFSQPLWVDDNEVWLATGPASDPDGIHDFTGILRVARSSLGSPTVPTGL